MGIRTPQAGAQGGGDTGNTSSRRRSALRGRRGVAAGTPQQLRGWPHGAPHPEGSAKMYGKEVLLVVVRPKEGRIALYLEQGRANNGRMYHVNLVVSETSCFSLGADVQVGDMWLF